MDENILRKQIDEFLRKPDEKRLRNLTANLKKYQEYPACSRCSSNDVVKLGMNPRNRGATQQYRCKECRHIYSESSIKSKLRRSRYPPCPVCGCKVVKNGSWSWKLKDGTGRKKQKYHCTSCGHYFRLKKKQHQSG